MNEPSRTIPGERRCIRSRGVLGRTGLRVSRVGLGTVGLGTSYGIPAPEGIQPPAEEVAQAVCRHASNAGIDLFDTAPSYGRSEKILGAALRSDPDVIIAGKFSFPVQGPLEAAIQATLTSIDRSLELLRRDRFKLLQVHNATAEMFQAGRLDRLLDRILEAGKTEHFGASVYEPRDALAMIKSGRIDVLQVPLNAFDTRWKAAVLPAATEANVGVMARSVLLKGVFTRRSLHLPPELLPLGSAVQAIKNGLGVSWESMPGLALRYALGVEGVATVLVGAKSIDELDDALLAVSEGPLEADTTSLLENAYRGDPRLLDPRIWPVP